MVQRGAKASDPHNAIDADIARVLGEDEDEAVSIISQWVEWSNDRLTPIGNNQ